jgi:hypothetical protein
MGMVKEIYHRFINFYYFMLLKYTTFIILSIISFSAFTQINYYKSIDTNKLFFPSRYFIDTVNTYGREKNKEFYETRMQGNYFKNAVYSEKLLRLKEPKLFSDYKQETYRFTWSGYVGKSHNPLSLRLEKHNENIYLFVKYINGKSQKQGDILVTDTVVISENDWNTFKNKLDSIDFWNVPSVEKTDIVTMDGSVWILEGKHDNIYHMVHRQDGRNKEIGELCLYLLNLSNIRVKKKEFY